MEDKIMNNLFSKKIKEVKEDTHAYCWLGCTACWGSCHDTCFGVCSSCSNLCSGCTGLCRSNQTGGCSGCSITCQGSCTGSCMYTSSGSGGGGHPLPEEY
ncbi:MAG: Cys-rich RiPP precursor [Bacteroidales bacterium]|nr:MAG: Cys-rich RiPP precursor [Bacteroidales bacterium]